jgi:hypothetical protein
MTSVDRSSKYLGCTWIVLFTEEEKKLLGFTSPGISCVRCRWLVEIFIDCMYPESNLELFTSEVRKILNDPDKLAFYTMKEEFENE